MSSFVIQVHFISTIFFLCSSLSTSLLFFSSQCVVCCWNCNSYANLKVFVASLKMWMKLCSFFFSRIFHAGVSRLFLQLKNKRNFQVLQNCWWGTYSFFLFVSIIIFLCVVNGMKKIMKIYRCFFPLKCVSVHFCAIWCKFYWKV